MTLAEIARWQEAAIVALILTNALSLLIAAVAISIVRLGMADLPPAVARLIDRIGGPR
jgi:hypothetical protein